MAALKHHRGRIATHVTACRKDRLWRAFNVPGSIDGVILLAVLRATDGGVWISRRKLVERTMAETSLSRARVEFLINDMVRVGSFSVRLIKTGRPGRPGQELMRWLDEPETAWR